MPVQIERQDDRNIAIEWSDGLQQTLSSRLLRDHCPCATCRTPEQTTEVHSGTGKSNAESKPAGLRVLSAAETLPLEVVSMRPVGNYAYHIQFSDGHDTGIFTFELLRAIASK